MYFALASTIKFDSICKIKHVNAWPTRTVSGMLVKEHVMENEINVAEVAAGVLRILEDTKPDWYRETNVRPGGEGELIEGEFLTISPAFPIFKPLHEFPKNEQQLLLRKEETYQKVRRAANFGYAFSLTIGTTTGGEWLAITSVSTLAVTGRGGTANRAIENVLTARDEAFARLNAH